MLGICGGYQMLGNSIDDPEGIEDTPGFSTGFGLLNTTTVLKAVKHLGQASGHFNHPDFGNAAFSGYEIHCGDTTAAADQPNRTFSTINSDSTSRLEGAYSADHNVMGTYIHGIFDQPTAALAILQWAGLNTTTQVDLNSVREDQLDRLAQTLEEHFAPSFFDQLVQ